jgi:hypothetical protein
MDTWEYPSAWVGWRVRSGLGMALAWGWGLGSPRQRVLSVSSQRSQQLPAPTNCAGGAAACGGESLGGACRVGASESVE